MVVNSTKLLGHLYAFDFNSGDRGQCSFESRSKSVQCFSLQSPWHQAMRAYYVCPKLVGDGMIVVILGLNEYV